MWRIVGNGGAQGGTTTPMVKALTRTVFFGTFRHSVDEKNRVAIPAKWRATARGSKEFYVLPDPKNCLVVLPASAMEKMQPY